MVKAKKTPKIIGIGDVVFDIFPDSRKLGGAPADFLKYAVMYGAEGHLISAVGADDLGREVVTELKKAQIDPVLAITPYPTGRVLIFNNTGKGPVAHILENAAWDYIPYTGTAEECVKKADAVYFGTLSMRNAYSRGTILDLIDIAPKNAYRFFDINLRQNYYQQSLIFQLLERADIFKVNAEEFKALKNILNLSGSLESVAQKLQEKYDLKYFIFTNSSEENRIFGPDNQVTVMQNKDLQQTFAFGVGNAFSGAFMSAIAQGKSQQEAHEIANKAASEVCLNLKGVQRAS